MDTITIEKDAEGYRRIFESEKVEENYFRRWAKRLGLILKKSRGKMWSIDNQGGYMLTDFNNNIQAGEKFDLTLENVGKVLEDCQRQHYDLMPHKW